MGTILSTYIYSSEYQTSISLNKKWGSCDTQEYVLNIINTHSKNAFVEYIGKTFELDCSKISEQSIYKIGLLKINKYKFEFHYYVHYYNKKKCMTIKNKKMIRKYDIRDPKYN